jgi:hypothetical protein
VVVSGVGRAVGQALQLMQVKAPAIQLTHYRFVEDQKRLCPFAVEPPTIAADAAFAARVSLSVFA